jgi:hypothetical protein
MSKTVAFTKLVRRSKLADEMLAAMGAANLITCRLSGPSPDLADGGEVVVADSVSESAVQAVIAAHTPTQSSEEKFDDEPSLRQGRVLAAVTLRASGQWAGLTAQQKARVQAVIDQAATRLTQLLQS